MIKDVQEKWQIYIRPRGSRNHRIEPESFYGSKEEAEKRIVVLEKNFPTLKGKLMAIKAV